MGKMALSRCNWWVLLTGASLAAAIGQRPRTGNWTTLNCEHAAIVDATTFTSEQRWSVLDADHAWADVVDAWRNEYKPEARFRSFQQAVFYDLSTHEGTTCGEVSGIGGCHTPMSCEDRFKGQTGAATAIIMNSFVAVHLVLSNLYRALRDLAMRDLPRFGLDFDILSKDGSRNEEDTARIAPVLLDTINLAPLIALAPSFNISIDENKDFTAGPAARKAIVDEFVSILAPIVEERLKVTNASEDAWGYQVTSALAKGYLNTAYIHHAWMNLTATAGYRLFSGSEESIARLTRLISDGKMLAANRTTLPGEHLIPETAAATRRAAITRAVYAFALPAAWSANSAGVFVFDSGLACSESSNGAPPESDLVDIPSTAMSQKTARSTASCQNAKLYFLVSASGDGPAAFSVPKGLELLERAEYGRLSRHDIILAAIRTYENNGKKNGAPKIKPTDAAVLNNLYTEGVLTPGYVRLAVCGRDEVDRNRGKTGGCETYPCDRVGPSSRASRSAGGLGGGLWWCLLLAVFCIF
ncbi:hypothetical protein QBC34DRAFT_477065 [Podospora aff. communis PSN243]|uniref:Uncharacterized protein n=1 Tax=Podospora aff. communis PSN243 TaxID=3040156 RepID=A0AAV9G812_9PEZI|nr:hypothetical protein QBC34DRAFT_477065 [Podospora aff. communis PSN243]